MRYNSMTFEPNHVEIMDAVGDEKRVLAQFKSEEGVLVGTPFDLPLGVTKDSLAALCNAILENVSRANHAHHNVLVGLFAKSGRRFRMKRRRTSSTSTSWRCERAWQRFWSGGAGAQRTSWRLSTSHRPSSGSAR